MTATLEARFLSVISHELRTPLTTIASFTESLDHDDLAPDERSLALSAVRRNTDRMLTLVEDLMVVSRLQTGDLPLSPSTATLEPILRSAIDQLTDREPDTAVKVVAGDGPPLRGDASRLCELFYAVLGAVASGAADRSVSITASCDADHWTVTITARQAAPFTDESLMAGMLADPAPPHRRRSTALWMMLAEAIAMRHGGSAELTHDPAVGAGALVKLPLALPGKPTE